MESYDVTYYNIFPFLVLVSRTSTLKIKNLIINYHDWKKYFLILYSLSERCIDRIDETQKDDRLENMKVWANSTIQDWRNNPFCASFIKNKCLVLQGETWCLFTCQKQKQSGCLQSYQKCIFVGPQPNLLLQSLQAQRSVESLQFLYRKHWLPVSSSKQQ